MSEPKVRGLEIINYSTKKHVDRQTLRQIRSHAQQRVQDRKKPNRRPATEKSTSASAATTGASSSLVKSNQDGTAAIEAPVPPIVRMDGREDPFGAFPVKIDAEFMQMFDLFFDHWNWQRPKDFLFREIVSNELHTQSWLAISYRIWRGDNVRSMSMVNKTIHGIVEIMTQIRMETNPRPELAYVVIVAVARLAMLDVYEGHYDRAIHHLKAFMSMCPKLNGFQRGYFVVLLQSAIAALSLSNVPGGGWIARDCLTYPQNLSADALDGVLAQGFRVPHTALFHGPEIKALVASPTITDIFLTLTALFNTEVDPTLTTRQSILNSQLALRLADTVKMGAVPSAESELQACLRRTALLFTWPADSHDNNEFVSRARRENRESLSSQMLSHLLHTGPATTSDLLLWLLLVNGSSRRVITTLLPGSLGDTDYYADLIRTTFPEMIYWSYHMLRTHLGNKLPWSESTWLCLPAYEFWNLVTAQPEMEKLKIAVGRLGHGVWPESGGDQRGATEDRSM